MIREAVQHRANRIDAYAINSKELQILLKTKKNDVEKVELLIGDPYDWKGSRWNFTTVSMTISGRDELFDYWIANVTPELRRLRYGFNLFNKKESVFYGEKGFRNDPPEDIGDYFCFPYLNKADIFTAPEWVKNTVWYQIFPERFANGDPSLNPESTVPWGSEEPKVNNFFGGDLQGVIDHLDYLEDLGISGIYFTPIFKATSNHKYDTIDYFEIDEHFGDKELLKKLIAECKNRGIRVMLDAVFNHGGFYFPPFQDVLKRGKGSKYNEWFHLWEYPVETRPKPNYDTFGFEYKMPKFNTENPEVKNYLLEVGRYWAREFDIDAWRLDVANEVDQSFWREFRKEVKAINPDLYILGEIWHDAIPWLKGDQFDAVMNYPFTNNVLLLFAKKEITPKQFVENMTKVQHMYPKNINLVTFNLVGSHDTPRILTECGNDKQSLKQVFTLLLTYYGTPSIYYGDEIGLTGEQDPGCRKCMEWEEHNQDTDLRDFVKTLISLRKKEPLLANEGSFIFLSPELSDKSFGYVHSNDTESIIVLFNTSDKKDKVKLLFDSTPSSVDDLLTDQKIKWKNGKITLEPHEAKLIKLTH
ncbi:glycoside hydrolase family 13 protein [Jeotgalibacillus proteolyticus]|uniref:Alpha-glycosidase n=1 Tax=Jeotgalibacillus proteolyticus TaxID=2082395 RepID=A0A2S5GH97_9BACL|nr:glycoside hydrolase family 13 protein [Jeotgalibacillus proteolyticus]PPA72359.1 alpha-glycosidase [Jeotgalibacillus proteolyticus]